jgi:hypothetical protein
VSRWFVFGITASALIAALSFGFEATRAAGPTDWKLKKFFDPSTSELRLETSHPGYEKDCDWKGPAGGVNYTNTIEPLDWPIWNCPVDVLWAKTCKPGRQTVTFTKRFYLPGPAQDLDVSLVSYREAPLSMSIEINNGLALNAIRSVHKRDLRGKESLFKVGQNTVTVEATKPKTGKPCNVGSFEFGFYMQMRAVFANDIVVEKIPRTPSGGFGFNLSVTNRGPSKASLANVVFGAYTPNLKTATLNGQKAAVLITGPGVDPGECSYSYSSVYYKGVSYVGYSTNCPIQGGLDPGESNNYRIIYTYNDPGTPLFEEWPANFGASGDLLDPKPGNSQSWRLQGVCRPAQPPKCVSP